MNDSNAQENARPEVNHQGTPPTGRFWPRGLSEAIEEANRRPIESTFQSFVESERSLTSEERASREGAVKPLTPFHQELEQLINKHSKESGSDTPDFILARFMGQSLNTFNETVNARERWYGRDGVSKDDRKPCCGVNEVCSRPDCTGTSSPSVVSQGTSTASHWATAKAASAWCSDRTEHKVMDRDLCEAFAQILDQVRGELTYDKPAAIAVHQPDYKEGEWKHMSFIELGTWVDQLVKRAARRSNDSKREKDLYDAGNYLAMFKHKFEDVKTALGF